jgi:hypothetical protein
VTGSWDIDLRSKRKMRQMGERYFFVINNGGAATATFSIFTRTLVLLP